MRSTPLNISLFTPTGDRPEDFALCQKYVRRFAGLESVAQWLILDDGDAPIEPNDKSTKFDEKIQYPFCPQFRGQDSLHKKIHHILSHELVPCHRNNLNN